MTPLSRKWVEETITGWLLVNYPEVPIKLPNVPFKQPSAPFMHLNIMHGDPQRSGIGPHSYTIEPKVLQLDTLVPDDTGSQYAYDITRSALTACFTDRDVILSGSEALRFYTSGISASSNVGNWYRVIGSATFELRIRKP